MSAVRQPLLKREKWTQVSVQRTDANLRHQAVERRRLGSPLGSLRTAEGGKSGMIYVKSILVGLACVCVASFLMLEAMSAYLSVVYHVETGPIGWNSSFLASPLNWFLTATMFLVGFFWEFRRARSK